MGLHINDIRQLYNNGEYTVKYDIGSNCKLPDTHIFDEELSVKRNREMVVEHNQKIDELKATQRQKQFELDKALTEDVVSYIKENYELTDKQARIVEQWVYREHHSFMCDYFSYIDTFADFAERLLNSEED